MPGPSVNPNKTVQPSDIDEKTITIVIPENAFEGKEGRTYPPEDIRHEVTEKRVPKRKRLVGETTTPEPRDKNHTSIYRAYRNGRSLALRGGKLPTEEELINRTDQKRYTKPEAKAYLKGFDRGVGDPETQKKRHERFYKGESKKGVKNPRDPYQTDTNTDPVTYIGQILAEAEGRHMAHTSMERPKLYELMYGYKKYTTQEAEALLKAFDATKNRNNAERAHPVPKNKNHKMNVDFLTNKEDAADDERVPLPRKSQSPK
jgi:hypothetical protein